MAYEDKATLRERIDGMHPNASIRSALPENIRSTLHAIVDSTADINSSVGEPETIFGSKTGAITLPLGTTEQRPSSPLEGMLRYNTSLTRMEGYFNGWVPVADEASLAVLRATLLNIKDPVRMGTKQAAIGDGTLHLASEYYASLGELQADYPNATSLSHSMDQIVIDFVVNSELDAFIPHGTYMFNFESPNRTNKSFIFVGEKGTIFKGAGSGIDGRMMTFTGGTIRIDNIKFDMDNKFREVIVLSSVDYTENDCEYVNGGLGATAVTDYTTYVHMSGTNITFRIHNQKCRDITATGNNGAAGGSALGAARYLLIEPSVNATVDGEIHNCNWKAGTSEAREFDIVNQNVNVLIGGTVFYGGIFEHSEYVRRDVKLHSGLFRFFGTRFVQSPDFTPAPPYGGVGVQSEAGINNIEIIGQAGSAAYPSRLELYNCFIDYRASGTGGFINSGNSTESSIYSFGCKYLGPTTTINRINPETGAAQTGSAIGFRGGLASLGCGVENSTFIDGLIPIQINGKNQFARNNIVDDPVTYAIYLNDTATTGTAQAGGTTTTIVLSSGASNVTDFYKGRKVLITAGTNAGYYGDIVAYNGSTKTATVSPAATSSFDATSVYSLCGNGIDISGNRVIHRTAGRLTGTEVIRLQGGLATSVNCQNNEFVRQRNVGSFLNYDAQTANFTQGKTITGATSGATATILYDKDSGTTGTLVLGSVVGTFIDNETITDDNGTPGSATTNGVVTTDVSTIARFINPVTDIYGTIANNRCDSLGTICVNISSTNTKASIYNNNNVPHVRANTNTTYTVNQSDNQNYGTHSNAAAITITLPKNAPAGFYTIREQLGAGAMVFAAEAGGTVTSSTGSLISRGQYSSVVAYVRTNTTGTNAAWVLSGDLMTRPNAATTAVGNVGTGEDNLQTRIIPAYTLNTVGDVITITARGSFANNANAKTLKFYWGSEVIYTKALPTAVTGNFQITATVARTGANTQDIEITAFITNAAGTGTDIEMSRTTGTQTDTAAIIVKCTGEGVSNNDIVNEMLWYT